VGINTSNPAVGLEINTTDAILISKGTTAQRPSAPILGHVRYNTETSQFEGFGAGSAWGSLGGVKSTNQQTFVSAEEYPTSNDDNIRFVNSNIESMRITRNRLVGVNTSNPSERVDIIGNTKVSSNVYVLNRVGINTSNPVVGLEVNTTDAVLISKGTSAQRPSAPILGHVRYNTETSQFEGFGAGSAWGSLGGVKSTNQQTFVSAEEYPTSNDDNIRFVNSNIESMRITRNRFVGVNTSNPSERVDIIGNTKVSSNVYVLNRVGINTSNPVVGLEVNTTDAVLISKGTSSQRPSAPILGHIRYNTETSQFEGFGAGSAWGSLGGVKSTNQQTFVSAEEYPTSNDDNIRFVNSNIESLRITRSRLVGINTSNPTERLEVNGNVKITSNLYVDTRIGVGTSNPQSPIEVIGDVKSTTINTSNVSTSNITASNARTCNLHVNTIVASNIITSNLVIVNSNISTNNITADETINSSNIFTSNIYTSRRMGVGTSNPQFTFEVQGTAYISGATILSNSLNMTGPMTLCNTLNVSGATVLNGPSTFSNSVIASGPVSLSNTLTVAGVALMSNDLVVNGRSTLCNQTNIFGATTLSNTLVVSGITTLSNALTTFNGTTTHSNAVIVSGVTTLSNNLNVSGPMTLCNTMNVSGAVLLSNTLMAYGATTLSNTVTIAGATTLSNTLNVSGATVLSNALTTFNGTTTHSNAVVVSGVTTLSNNLNVSGSMTLCNTMNVSGAALLSNTLMAYGATTLSNNVTIAGATTLSNSLNVSGATVLSNALTTFNGPSTFSNNVIVSGTTTLSNALNVSGATTMSNTLNVSGVTILSNALTTFNGTTTHSNAVIVSGVTTLSNNLNVSGAMTLSNTLNVSGVTILSNALTTFNGTTTHSNAVIVSGVTTLSNNLNVSGAMTLSNTLNVSGATILSNALTTFNGPSTFSNNVIVSGTTTLSNNLNVSGALTLSNTLNVSGAALMSNTLIAYGATTLSNTVTISGSTTLSNTLNVSGATILSNALTTFNGTTTHSNAVIVSGITTLSNNLNVSGPLTLSNTMNVSGAALLSNTLIAYGATTLSNTVTISGSTTLSNTLNVSGAVLLSNGVTVYNGTSTFSNDIITSGNIGVGTNAPTAKLDVRGAIFINGATGQYQSASFASKKEFIKFSATDTGSSDFARIYAEGPNNAGKLVIAIQDDMDSSEALVIRGEKFDGTTSDHMVIRNDGLVGIGTSSNMTEKLQVSGGKIYSDQQVLGNSNDSATLPSFTFKEDSNTGMFHPSNDAIGFTTAGTEKVRINSNGQVGVGTTTPTEVFDVVGNAKVSSNLYVSRVGVGTSNITTTSNILLHVAGNARIEGNLDVSGIYNIMNTDVKVTDQFTVSNIGTGPALNVYQFGAQPIADFYDDNTIAMRIADGGSVGIKTATPSETLDVNGSAKVGTNAFVMGNMGVGTSNVGYKLDVLGSLRATNPGTSLLMLLSNNTNPYMQIQSGTNSFVAGVVTSAGAHSADSAVGDVVIKTLPVGTSGRMLIQLGNGSSAMTINSNQDVGIGTATPAYKFDVNGTINATAYVGPTITSLSNLGMFSSNTAISASNTTISLSNYVYGTNTTNISWASNTAVFGSNTAVAASNRTFSTWGVTNSNIFIGTNSNLGIGTTNPAYKLDVNGFTRSTGFINTSHTAFFDTTLNGIKNIATFTGTAPFQCVFRVSIISTAGSGRTMCKNHIIAAYFNSTNSTWQRCLALNGGVNSTNGDYELQMNMTGSTVAFRVVHTSAPVTDSVTVNICCEYSQGNVPTVTDNTTDAQYTDVNLGTYVFHDSTQITQRFGLVGIGLSNPSEKLDVFGKIYSSTQFLNNSNDSATVPAFSFKEDSNTGMYHASNDAIGFTTNGSEKMRIDTNGNVGIGTVSPSAKLDVNGTINSTGDMTGPTITSLSNLGMFSSNTAISASNTTISLSNYVYGTSTTNNTNVQTTANWASNAGLFGSNTSVSASNTTISLSNYVYGTNTTNITNAQTTANWASNAGLFGSNTSVSASNTTISLSNFVYGINTTNITNAQTTANWASNAGLFGSNTSVSASNTTISLSNFVYGTNTTNISWTSNSAVFGSNTSVSASNTVISLSNFVYGNSTTNISWTSNAATFGSNTSVWTSNNMFNKAGGTISGNTTIQGTTGLSNTVTVFATSTATGALLSMNSTAGSGGRDFRILSTLSGNAGGAGGFQVFDQNAATARLHIDSNGNVGIGTTSPTYRLDVSGDINFSGVFRQNGVPYIGSQWSNNSSNIFIFGSNIGINTSNAVEDLTVIGGKIYTDTQFLANSNDSSNAPSFAFREDSNTGLYHPSNDTLGFVAGGVETFRITPGQFTVNSTLDIASNLSVGSNITASGSLILGNRLVINSLKVNRKEGLDVNVTQTKVLGFSNATNGIILDVGSNAPASNQTMRVTWSNNTELFHLNGQGKAFFASNVGIKTSSPAYSLDVVGDINFTGILRQNNNAYVTSQWTTGSGSNIYIINSNVGIGTTGAVHTLETNGSIMIANNNTYISLNANNARAPFGMIKKSGVSPAFAFTSNFLDTNVANSMRFEMVSGTHLSNIAIETPVELMRLTNSGSLGLGTGSPQFRLDVNNGDLVIRNGANANNAGGAINFGIAANSNAAPMANIKGVLANLDGSGNTLAGGITFNVRSNVTPAGGANAASFTEAMRITTNGNIGIGNTSPGYTMQVNGTIFTTSNVYANNGLTNLPQFGTIGSTGDRFILWPGSGSTHPYSLGMNTNTMWSSVPSGAQHQWYVNGNLGMTLSNNLLGVGTATPNYRVDVTGDIRASGEIISTSTNSMRMVQGNFGVYSRNDGSDYYLMMTGSGTPYGSFNSFRPYRLNFASGDVYIGDTALYVRNNGFVGINTTSPSERLNVSGNILASGNITAYSDARAKSNLEVITNPLTKVSQLNGYTYEMIENPDLTTKITPRFTGVIAQELEKVLPEAVHKDNNGKFSVAYGNMAGLFIESIKELTKENTDLKQKVTTLEDRLAKLEAFVSSMV
jgi:hypothetical protein